MRPSPRPHPGSKKGSEAFRLPWIGGGGLFVALTLTGCVPRTDTGHSPTVQVAADRQTEETLAPGVVHRALPTGDQGGVDLVDVDLTRAAVRPAVVAEDIRRTRVGITGRARTPREWLAETGGLAAINGGYFGVDEGESRKAFVGLLIQEGRVRHAAPRLRGQGTATLAAGYYTRSAFGVLPDGTPDIRWVATNSLIPQTYPDPLRASPGTGDRWPAQSAVGCGPMLIRDGRIVLTARAERLVSPDPRPRTFVAYDVSGARPAHFVMGVTSAMRYSDLAAFLQDYFQRSHHSRAAAAMCLDGGSSSQFSYRQGGVVRSPLETGTPVPDAVVLLPR